MPNGAQFAHSHPGLKTQKSPWTREQRGAERHLRETEGQQVDEGQAQRASGIDVARVPVMRSARVCSPLRSRLVGEWFSAPPFCCWGRSHPAHAPEGDTHGAPPACTLIVRIVFPTPSLRCPLFLSSARDQRGQARRFRLRFAHSAEKTPQYLLPLRWLRFRGTGGGKQAHVE
jgi:hypothetical protein